MKHLLALSLSIFSFICYGQNHWKWHDSIINTSQNWDSLKNYFIPSDISNFPLIFEELNDDQISKNGDLMGLNYWNKHDGLEETNCTHLKGNVPFNQYQSHKWFKKYYQGEFSIINYDSINTLSKEKYPYVLMFYFETITAKQIKNSEMFMPLAGRCGYYIWDRRNDYKYLVYSCLGKREEKRFFLQLNK